MIKNVVLYKVLVLIILLLSFLSYEIHLYKYYFVFQFILSLLLLFMLLIVTKIDEDVSKTIRKKLSDHYKIFLLFFLMIINTIFGILLFNYTSLLTVIKILLLLINTISFFIMLPILFKKYDSLLMFFENSVIVICSILSLIAIAIKLKGSFLGYTYLYRISGIYSDPNFFAMVLSITILLIINNVNSNKKFLIVLPAILYALFLTGSRGAILGLSISLFFLVRKKINVNIAMRFFFLITYFAVVYFVLLKLKDTNFFRVYQGSNGRYEMVMSAFDAIKKSPIFGYGYSSIETYLHIKGFNNASTHNSFVDFLFSYGVLPTMIYIYIFIYNIYNSLKYKFNKNYSLILVFMLVNMNTILYNLGGVGISSLLLTIFLGYTNYNILLIKEGDKQ